MTKSCTLCGGPRSILVRCQIDETQKWHFVCPGACWKSVSGGVEDAKGMQDEFPHYRYGGMVSLLLTAAAAYLFYDTDARCVKWKDRSPDGPVSAKKPKKVKERQEREKNARNRTMETAS